ncbi:MAG TPA: hypothetical protein PLX85_00560 [Dehalococcoidia bacterium]|nr:hypothetical protein [Dehalococcoidia bacterium]
MSASNAMENKLLSLYFENANAANVGDATGLRGSTTAGSTYCGLTTADPGEAGSQTTSETAYSNYARQAVARSTAGWTVASGVADNDAAITFPTCGVTGSTITNTTLGSAVSGAGDLDFSGTASLVISQNITPSFGIGQLDISSD